VLPASVDRLLAELPADASLLDVGGGVLPLNRADYVMDALAYADRASFGSLGPPPERFTEDTWIQRDICDREPWPFDDKQIDFAVCSHTLEDVRDPVWMCSEFNRIAKAGYIEVPSRLEEQTYGFQGPWTGWSHHRWLIDADQAANHIQFVHKSAVVERADSHFPTDFRDTLSEAERVQTFWWEGSFDFGERLFWDPLEFDAWLAAPLLGRKLPRSGSRWRRLTGLW
jgi:hypothetical protein